MSDFAVIVTPTGRLWQARVVHGTIQSYYPRPHARFVRPLPGWAKRAGERWIRRHERAESRRRAREMRARKITGYGQEDEQ